MVTTLDIIPKTNPNKLIISTNILQPHDKFEKDLLFLEILLNITMHMQGVASITAIGNKIKNKNICPNFLSKTLILPPLYLNYIPVQPNGFIPE